ncbi:putative holin-like toxin [Gracilibacillus halotolerans]
MAVTPFSDSTRNREGKGGDNLSVYEALVIMISFASLIVLIVKDKE